MIQIDHAVQAGEWGNEAQLAHLTERAIRATLDNISHDLSDECEVSIVFSNDDEVQKLNEQWRGQDKPTNVLSFAANEGDGPVTPVLGDIILAQETVEKEAEEQGKAFSDHLTHLIIHGFLHLLGYDHIKDKEAAEMEAVEILILNHLGIADPYASL